MRFPACLLLALTIATPAAAQRVMLREQLTRTNMARVTQDGVQRLVPQPYLTEDDLLRSRSDTSIAIPLVLIARLDRRTSGAGQGAALGAAIAGGAGLLLGTALAGDESFDVDAGAAVGGALVFALAGAGVGAMIGSQRQRWQTIHRAPPGAGPVVHSTGRGWRIGMSLRF